jgi:crotonobetainyl-CoA:carnitine CoA-transferase CaiB-like acyl-CoA transferase
MLALGIPAGPIEDVATALESEHAAARGLTPTVTLGNGETTRLVGPPVGFSATPPTVRTPPPSHGQHTDELLRALGLDTATLADYRARGVV